MPETPKRRIKGFLGLFIFCAAAWLLISREEVPAPEPTAATPAHSELQAALAPARIGRAEPPLPPEYMPAPFEDRMIRRPEPGAPRPSQTASLCSEENGERMKALVSRGSDRQFVVDPAAWRASLASTRAGIASWVSLCEGDGGTIDIIASGSGQFLATYDAQSGLREP